MSRRDTAQDRSFARALERLDGRVDWERRDRAKGWRVDLEPMRDLVQRLGDPLRGDCQRGVPCVHVAGSKGKGSVASLIATALSSRGQRVGVYGSPHVETIRERIRIDGAPIDEAPFAAAAHRALDAADAARVDGSPAAGASWFDIVTATSFCAFSDARVDRAVLEVGLGGRLDSTNVIRAPEVCVITSIALEHTAILGDTHAAIAREKAGIVKPGTTLVSGCDPKGEAGRTIADVARGHDVPLVVAFDAQDVTFEARNVRTARAALDAIEGASGAWLDDATIRAARLPGRMELRQAAGVPVVLDGAHVASSIADAFDEAPRLVGRSSAPIVVIAVHREKNAAGLAAPFAGRAARVVATTIPGSGVHLDAQAVASAVRSSGDEADAIEAPLDALTHARDLAQERDTWILVIGSLYLVGAVRAALDPMG